jgi:hypothetical protein
MINWANNPQQPLTMAAMRVGRTVYPAIPDPIPRVPLMPNAVTTLVDTPEGDDLNVMLYGLLHAIEYGFKASSQRRRAANCREQIQEAPVHIFTWRPSTTGPYARPPSHFTRIMADAARHADREAVLLDQHADKYIELVWPVLLQYLPSCKTQEGWLVGDFLYSILKRADRYDCGRMFNIREEAFPNWNARLD